LQEVRAALDDFRASGKPITAFLEYGGAGEYYLASAADRDRPDAGWPARRHGLAFYEVFFRSALDKIGVYPDLLHIGEYKTASNTFTEKSFTAAHREMTRSLNRDWYDELVRGIAKGRKISEDAARAAMDKGPYLAADAAEGRTGRRVGLRGPARRQGAHSGHAAPRRGPVFRFRATTPYQAGADRIALIYAVGTITSGKSGDGAGTVLGSESFAEWMRRVRGDSTIRAVVVRVDSPGGSAIASEVMWRELKLTQDVQTRRRVDG
jgi:protease-4